MGGRLEDGGYLGGGSLQPLSRQEGRGDVWRKGEEWGAAHERAVDLIFSKMHSGAASDMSVA